ncbi:MAG: hypothetical protein WCI39_06220 [Gallionellaceae bacterium]
MSYEISWEAHTIITTWAGNASGDELLACVKEVHSNPCFDELRYSLHDFTACTDATFPTESVLLTAALDAAASMSNSHIKVGFVADRDDIKTMVKHYIGTEMSPYPVRSFPTVKVMRDWEARDWAEQ